MEYTLDMIDIAKLKAFLYDYYESAYFAGISVALGDLAYVKSLSDIELIQYASTRFDLTNFIKGKVK